MAREPANRPDVDSAGVYYMSVDDFESRSPARDPEREDGDEAETAADDAACDSNSTPKRGLAADSDPEGSASRKRSDR